MNFENFSNVRVLIIGDIMLDQYWWGRSARISPEAPVPVVAIDRKTETLGGAANCAANVAGLGATPFLLGLIGKDSEGSDIRRILLEQGISDQYLISSDSRPTTSKTRVVSDNQHVVRVDREVAVQIDNGLEDDIFRIFEKLAGEIDIVLVSDYAKGLVTGNLIARIIELAGKSQVPVLVDPKGKNYGKYRGAHLLTPNEGEALTAAGVDGLGATAVIEAGQKLVADNDFECLTITRGKDGMTLFERGLEPVNLKTRARRVFDVTGAGDTVISTLAVALGSGADFIVACELANSAAGVVVESVGTKPITTAELAERINIANGIGR